MGDANGKSVGLKFRLNTSYNHQFDLVVYAKLHSPVACIELIWTLHSLTITENRCIYEFEVEGISCFLHYRNWISIRYTYLRLMASSLQTVKGPTLEAPL